MRALPVLFVLGLLLLSGCSGHKPKAAAGPTDTANSLPQGVINILEGTVTGPDLIPLAGVNVTINGLGQSNMTDHAGGYHFENVPPRDYIITATKEGYRQKPQRAVIQEDAIFQLDFILEEIPIEVPYHTTRDKVLFISCELSYQSSPDNPTRADCGSSIPSAQPQSAKFDFDRLAAQVQTEFKWEPKTSAAKFLTITIDSLGDNAVEFAHDKGESGMKAVVSQSLMRKNFPEGGTIRVKVDSASGVLGDESAVDWGLAFQQDCTVWFTVFYVEPGPPAFTAIPK
jgi:hypothetical protein